MGCALSTKRGDWSGNDTDLDISFIVLIPLRPLPLSSTFVVTRSIFDMMLIHGISRFTIALIAERTPLEKPVKVTSMSVQTQKAFVAEVRCRRVTL